MPFIESGYPRCFPVSKELMTTVDGIDVEGFLKGHSYDVTITITKPFQNLYQCFGIMMQLRGHLSYDGDYGESRGLKTLVELYRMGQHLQLHEIFLRARLEQYEQRLVVLQGRNNEGAKLKVIDIREEFYESYWPEIVSLSLQECVWEVLAGRKSISTTSN